MALVPYRNNRQVDPLREVFNDQVFESFFPLLERTLSSGQWFPALDVSEDKDAFMIKADLPGLKKEDVRLSFDNGVLTIEGERRSEHEQKDKNFHRMERSYGKFVRSLNLGTGVDANAIKADYKDGVLHISVPKSEQVKPKAISINVG
jgi:HSP20 family protein